MSGLSYYLKNMFSRKLRIKLTKSPSFQRYELRPQRRDLYRHYGLFKSGFDVRELSFLIDMFGHGVRITVARLHLRARACVKRVTRVKSIILNILLVTCRLSFFALSIVGVIVREGDRKRTRRPCTVVIKRLNSLEHAY